MQLFLHRNQEQEAKQRFRGASAGGTQAVSRTPLPESLSSSGVRVSPALAIGAFALGALAVGAFAIGTLVIGKLFLGNVTIGRARIKKLAVDELTIGRSAKGGTLSEEHGVYEDIGQTAQHQSSVEKFS